MDSAKTFIALASGTLITLLAILLFTKNTEKELYIETVDMVMTQEGLTTTQEAMDHCPELQNIKRKMDRIGQLNSDIHSLTAGPAPYVAEKESIEIQAMNNEVHALRMDVKKELIELLHTYNQNQPTKIVGLGY